MNQTAVIKDLAYGPDPRHRADVYLPAAPNGAGVLLAHGGGWWMGDKSMETHLASALADAGYVTAAINYRLADGAAGANLFPTQADDVSAALDWFAAGPHRAPSGRYAAMGGSSGGNLAVEAAIRHSIPAVSWSGLLDLEGFMASHADAIPRQAIIDAGAQPGGIDQGGPDPAYYKWLVLNLLGGDLSRLHEATPSSRVGPATGPMFLANSLAELVPAGEAPRLALALVEAGIPAETMILAGSRHAEGYFTDAMPAALAFLGRNLGV
jgi:acetyl esterase/lipase